MLPPEYGRRARRYPVLYLLHGAGDTDRSWTTRTDVEALTDSLPDARQLIVVMPDAGRNQTAGWYSDWVSGNPAWERYHIDELIPWVDRTFRTIAARDGRAVAGLSMGGFGAMSYAARHPDLFAAAMSFSGFVDTTAAGPVEALALKGLHGSFGTPDDRVWGPYATDEVIWRDHNPADLALNLRSTVLGQWTGNGVVAPGDAPADGVTEAGVHSVNLTFHFKLLTLGIKHAFVDREGTHAWKYWQTDLHEALPVLLDVFAHPSPPPASFDYRSAESSFAVWGWQFGADRRRAPEFLDLNGVSSHGVRLTGSGQVGVVTPPSYRPRHAYRVSGIGPVVADATGRLHFSVDLGLPHRTQEYTAGAAGEAFRTTAVSIS